MLIRDVLARDLNQRIAEVIKVTQDDEATVYTELTEYVATPSIRQHYRRLLQGIAESQSDPTENTAAWISGFFGSGKSSFAKNLGYALANRTVLGHSAAELFKQAMGNDAVAEKVGALLDSINARIPFEVIMFDVSANHHVGPGEEPLTLIMYRVLLEYLGYCTDPVIANLEIDLEHRGQLAAFIARFDAAYPQGWKKLRGGSLGINAASATLHELDPRTFPDGGAWANVAFASQPITTPNQFVDRCFELLALRRPGKALAFVIDEVGQYVARSSTRLEDLRATIERLGQEGRNRTRQRQAKAPIWTFVTSQERLNEVVDAIEHTRMQIAKVQDRFAFTVDLEQSDIRAVATQRVLAKRPDAVPELQGMYQNARGQLETATRLEQSSRVTYVGEAEFVQFYPYLPHFIDLSVDIVSGIRLQPGADRHLGGSNRTIIKQSYEMLVAEQTGLAKREVGSLVTLDLIYDLVDTNLSGERRADIADIVRRFADAGDTMSWEARVAKALCLLEFVKDLPRSPANIAALLVDRMGMPAPVRAVEAALQRLEDAQFVRRTTEGFKLQTKEEKSWDVERREHLTTKRAERTTLLREAVSQIFGEADMKMYRYLDRSLHVGVALDGEHLVGTNQIPLALITVEDAAAVPERLRDAQAQSRVEVKRDCIFWVFALDDTVDALMRQIHASDWMVKKYEHLSSAEQIPGYYTVLLADEKKELARQTAQLRDHVEHLLSSGAGVFQGTTYDASTLGQSLPQQLAALYAHAMPNLYRNLALGARKLKGDEIARVLEAMNFEGLPPVLGDGDQGLGLIRRDGNRAVPNQQAPIAQEILRYLNEQDDYGQTVLGRELSEHFGGLGYGWDDDVIRLTLAVLLRAGALRVTTQGKAYFDAQPQPARAALTNATTFKAASFAPRRQIDLRLLVSAANKLETITGKPGIEAQESAIAQELHTFAASQAQTVLRAQALASAHRLPVADFLAEYATRMVGLQTAPPEECVQVLAGENETLRASYDRARQVCVALTDALVTLVEAARQVITDQWPILRTLPGDVAQQEANEAAANELTALLASATFYAGAARIRTLADTLHDAYAEHYRTQHSARATSYQRVIAELNERAEWSQLAEAQRDTLLNALTSSRCATDGLAGGASVCAHCRATLGQISADLDACDGRRRQALDRLRQMTAPPQAATRAAHRTVALRLVEYFDAPLETHDDVTAALQRLEHELHRLIAEGARIEVE